MTAALYCLRCLQMGLRLEDLEQISEGMVIDMLVEQGNDNETWQPVATQDDFDRF